MHRRFRPPQIEPLAALLTIAVLTIACLMPVHNDTWWHLRAGLEQWQRGELLFVDTLSSTAAGGFFWNHSWLSQIVFYGLYAAGGFPLLTATCAVLVASGWTVIWRLLRGTLPDRVLLLALAIAGSTTIWSVRPQVFSIALFPLVVWLVSRDRWWPVPLIAALWANLHAGVGVIAMLLAASVGAAVVWDRDRLPARALWAAVSGVATLLTPLGIRNWTEMAASMERSRVNQIQEWMMTPWPPQEIFFWGTAAVLIWLAVSRWRRIQTADDRVIVLLAVLLLPVAVRALRNVPTFMMIAVTAISRMLWQPAEAAETAELKFRPPAQPAEPTASAKAKASPPQLQRRRKFGPPAYGFGHPAALAGVAAVGVAAVWLIWSAWSTPWEMLGWRPMSARAAAAIAACQGTLYNTYEGGGPIIWFVPQQPVLVDSRQDPFPTALVQAATRVEAGGAYEALFAKYGVNCAALPPTSPAAMRLRQDRWVERYRDAQWVVLERPGASPAAPPSPAP